MCRTTTQLISGSFFCYLLFCLLRKCMVSVTRPECHVKYNILYPCTWDGGWVEVCVWPGGGGGGFVHAMPIFRRG